MTRSFEIRPDLDEGIDRKVLSQLRDRFLTLNGGRLNRANEGLSTRQRSVVTLLPLLFHVNHPLLPGYVSGTTPAGVSHFEPDALVLTEAQRLTRSFSYKPHRGNASLPIHGLFLMGSLGTLAQADQSDMDVWVCHDTVLSPEALVELRKKCQALELWAATMGAEAHFFLIDPDRFAQGERDSQLSGEDCGTTQHYLLLDEFYRTAIWLAGRTPLWWLVPVYEEARYSEYTSTLLSKRFIRADEVMDFGNLLHIPAAEFMGAGLWQLFKGIESPYKSVLKLLLTEVYASEHPHVQCLSLHLKQHVFANRLDLNELDPYMLVYRRIEAYLLERGEPQRLDLIRRSLYLKVNKKLTGLRRQANAGWQRELLERLASEWQWDERQLALLDARSHWKVQQVSSERRALVSELNYSYRFLTQLARSQNTVSTVDKRELNVLGRRLHATYERKAGKVEFVNPGIAPDIAEDTLTLVHTVDKREPGFSQWGVYNGTLGAHEWEFSAPIKRTRGLLELLAWCHLNRIIVSSTRLALHPGSTDLSEFELFNLLGALRQSIPTPLPLVHEHALLRASVPSEMLLLVNVGIDPLKHHQEQNILMTTERTDSLSYAGARENLVLTLDQITLNSWNEVLVNRFDGPSALLDCLADGLNNQPRSRIKPTIRVCCFCHNRAQAIAQRVEELVDTAHMLFAQRLSHRYLIQIEQGYHVLEMTPERVRHVALEDLAALGIYLGEALPGYSPIHLDAQALHDSDLSLLLPYGQPECIQVFYRVTESHADLYVLDEYNALWHQRVVYHDEQSLLLPLHRFLQSLMHRRGASLALDSPLQPPSIETLYYRLTPDGPTRARRLEQRRIQAAPGNKPFYDVQAIVEHISAASVSVTLYCNGKEFSELELGEQLFNAVARQILDQRRESERYRCYITDLDLSGVAGDAQGRTIAYLRYKAALEQSLNAAMDQA